MRLPDRHALVEETERGYSCVAERPYSFSRKGKLIPDGRNVYMLEIIARPDNGSIEIMKLFVAVRKGYPDTALPLIFRVRDKNNNINRDALKRVLLEAMLGEPLVNNADLCRIVHISADSQKGLVDPYKKLADLITEPPKYLKFN